MFIMCDIHVFYVCTPMYCQGPKVIKTFPMIKSTEHEIYHANKCKNTNNCWFFTFISMINTTSERLNTRKTNMIYK